MVAKNLPRIHDVPLAYSLALTRLSDLRAYIQRLVPATGLAATIVARKQSRCTSSETIQ